MDLKKYIYKNMKLYKFAKQSKTVIRGNFISPRFHKKDIVVCGMKRSGSTLLFNLIKEITNKIGNDRDTYFNDENDYIRLLNYEDYRYISKTHSYVPFVARRIKNGYTRGFFSHRDIRDVIVSLMQKGWVENIDHWLKTDQLEILINNSILWASVKNITIISYEELIKNGKDVIISIAKQVNINLTNDDINNILEKVSIKNTKKTIDSIKGNNEYDVKTQLHQNHIFDGKIGKWKKILTEEQISIINKRSNNFLKYFKYIV